MYLRRYQKGKIMGKQNTVKDFHPSTHIKWKLCLEEGSDNAVTVWYLYW
jgi:hypothetical protein